MLCSTEVSSVPLLFLLLILIITYYSFVSIDGSVFNFYIKRSVLKMHIYLMFYSFIPQKPVEHVFFARYLSRH